MEPIARYLHIGLTCGLSRRDVLRSTPGELGDLWELYLRAHGAKRKQDDG